MVRVPWTKRIIVFLMIWLVIAIFLACFLALFGTMIQPIFAGIFFRSRFSGKMLLLLFKQNFLVSFFGTFITERVLGQYISCSPLGYLCFFSPVFVYSFGCGFVLTESRMPLSYLFNTPSRLMRTGPSGRFRMGEEINLTIFNIFEARKTSHPNYLGAFISNMFISIVLLFAIFLIGLLILIFVIALIGLFMNIRAEEYTGDEVPAPP